MPDSRFADEYFVLGKDSTKRKVEQGEKCDFNELHSEFKGLVHAIVLARIPYDDVDDVVQEVFVSAYRGLKSLRNKESAGPWLATIARNKSVEYFRRRKPTEELFENSASRDRFDDEAIEALEAIRSLPETYRETLVLRLVEGMTGPEISKLTGLTEASVRVNLHRGMKKLRRKLGASR